MSQPAILDLRPSPLFSSYHQLSPTPFPIPPFHSPHPPPSGPVRLSSPSHSPGLTESLFLPPSAASLRPPSRCCTFNIQPPPTLCSRSHYPLLPPHHNQPTPPEPATLLYVSLARQGVVVHTEPIPRRTRRCYPLRKLRRSCKLRITENAN